MIPKIIHYCWFGGNPLPQSAIKCINSWKKFFPDYEIKEWNEDNFDVNIIPYTAEAYQAKKYAFVSDYARFWILYHHGGLYFDTDVEVIKPMDDIIAKGNFMGREAGGSMREICKDIYEVNNTLPLGHGQGISPGLGLGVAPGLGLGVAPGLGLYKEILDFYATLSFVNPDGSLNTHTVVEYTSSILLKHNIPDDNDNPVEVEGVWVYPADVFCPMDHTKGNVLNITSRSVSIHHYDCSWLDKNTTSYKLHILKNELSKIFGAKIISTLANIIKGRY